MLCEVTPSPPPAVVLSEAKDLRLLALSHQQILRLRLRMTTGGP
jgi:hypothetical protein